MSIYDAGTASLSASGQVTGVGTQWTKPLTLIRVGATIVFKTEPVQIYTISEITSDTSISVYNPNGETAPAGTSYAILAHDGISVQGLAQDVAETLRYYQSRETEVAAALDAFNNFDVNAFQNSVDQVNTQSQQVSSDASQVASDRAQVAADKNAAASSAASALADKNSAAASAVEAANSAASINPSNLLRVNSNLSDLSDKAVARANLGVNSKTEANALYASAFIYSGAAGGTSRILRFEEKSGLRIICKLITVVCPPSSSTAFSWLYANDSISAFNGAPFCSVCPVSGNSAGIKAGVEGLTSTSISGFIRNDNTSSITVYLSICVTGRTSA